MRNLRVRNGVVLLEIKGTFLLVSDREARKYCRYVWKINETGALIWNCLKEHLDLNGIVRRMMEEYEIDDQSLLEKDVASYIGQLKENGYLTEEEGNEV